MLIQWSRYFTNKVPVVRWRDHGHWVHLLCEIGGLNRRLESATEVCWPWAPIRHHIGEPVKEFTETGVPIHRNAECVVWVPKRSRIPHMMLVPHAHPFGMSLWWLQGLAISARFWLLSCNCDRVWSGRVWTPFVWEFQTSEIPGQGITQPWDPTTMARCREWGVIFLRLKGAWLRLDPTKTLPEAEASWLQTAVAATEQMLDEIIPRIRDLYVSPEPWTTEATHI